MYRMVSTISGGRVFNLPPVSDSNHLQVVFYVIGLLMIPTIRVLLCDYMRHHLAFYSTTTSS